jgi:DNA-directed DNA polymerase III PolC
VEELVGRAARMGMKHLALTDRNGLYGAVKFYREAREQGLDPILGAEVDDPKEPGRTAVVLAADRDGFQGLCRLVSSRHLKKGFRLGASLLELGAGCRILTDDADLLEELVGGGSGKNVFGEINPVTLKRGETEVRRLVSLARKAKVPLVATGDVYFAVPEGHRLHLVLRAIGENKTLEGLREEETASPVQYLAGEEEMAVRFREFPEALRAAADLAEECRVTLDLGEWKFPEVRMPPGESPFAHLWRLAAAGLEERYDQVTPEAVRRLVRELEVIEAGGFTPYFLLVHDIVRQAGLWGLRHVGRGSAANSLVSYCLGITAVDPLAHNLYFERFMNPARKSPPDIDLDFSWKERDRILDYVARRYGRERVAMISTHVTFGPRAAVRETARVLGLSPPEITRITRRIPHWSAGPLTELRENVPECRDLPLDEEPWAGIMAAAGRLLGCPRHLSVHPGGIIVTPGPLDRWVPMEKSSSGQVVTQYDMFGVEDMGLVKIDLLSQRSLGVVEDVLNGLRVRGVSPPVDDRKRVTCDDRARNLIRSGETMGCFYIESPAMRSLLRKLKTETFEELTAASSVIRPGVAESGMMAAYIERHHDPEKIEYIHPVLEKVLGETYGVMIYQEDVIRVAHELAGMSLADADLLRRSMSGKMRSPEAMAGVERGFLESAAKKGVPGAAALEIWRQMKSFAGYAFCKAHSASYAVLSFQTAYLKARYPACFMAAVLSNGGGYYSAGAYVQECRRLGLRVLPPDVNRSSEEYTAEGRGVRVGLMAVKGLTRRGLEAILGTRQEDGPFVSLEDLARRTPLGGHEMEGLVRCGACGCFGESRPALLWKVVAAGGREPGDLGLTAGPRIDLPPLEDYTLLERCVAEADILGFTVSAHPLELFRERIPRDVVPSSVMDTYVGRRVRMAGWPIAWKRVRTKEGKVMKFLSLEDLTGTFETVLFPEVYHRVAPAASGSGVMLVEGKVQDDFGVCVLVAGGLKRLTLEGEEEPGPFSATRRRGR